MDLVSNEDMMPGDQASSLLQETSSSVEAFMKQVNHREKASHITSAPIHVRHLTLATAETSMTSPTSVKCTTHQVSLRSAPTYRWFRVHQSSQVVPPNTTEYIAFHNDDSVTTTDSYTTASHPTVSEDFQLRCYNCLRREQRSSDSASSSRGQGYSEDSAHELPELDREPLCCTLSPLTFLDHHIQLGGQVHARQLSGIRTVDVPAPHKELHAKRNQQSLRRIVKTVALEEENAPMHVQMRLQEDEIQSLHVDLKLEQAQKQQLRATTESHEYEKEVAQNQLDDTAAMDSWQSNWRNQLRVRNI
ncbi:hypothetical protein LSAT2_000288 [Lamellibrachia satsuma]|nr:hypothetical protein LSAT2_000288 [Lamellibrachia satsuma]